MSDADCKGRELFCYWEELCYARSEFTSEALQAEHIRGFTGTRHRRDGSLIGGRNPANLPARVTDAFREP